MQLLGIHAATAVGQALLASITFSVPCGATTITTTLGPPRDPKCPAAYKDVTHGRAYWWECVGLKCPEQKPWAHEGCGCACVLPHEYDAYMATTSTYPPARVTVTTTVASVANPWTTSGDGSGDS